MSWGTAHAGHVLDGIAGGGVLERVGPVLECDTAVTASDDRGGKDVGCDYGVRLPGQVRWFGCTSIFIVSDAAVRRLKSWSTLLFMREYHSELTQALVVRKNVFLGLLQELP